MSGVLKLSGVPVNLEIEQTEPGKTVVLVDLPTDQAAALQSAAWATWRQIKRNGGYMKVSPVPPPTFAPLPIGEPLSTPNLEGTWSGRLLFYPVGPVEMLFELKREGESWHGHLELKYVSKDFADESFDLVDLDIGDRELSFTDPKSVGVNNLKVQFRGVNTRQNELRGTAETRLDRPDSPVRLLGSWKLHKK